MHPDYDPFNAAANPEVRASEYFGQVVLDIWPCILEKGRGKVPFDPGQHDPNKRLTAVQVHVIPLAEHNMSRDVGRDLIAESSEWAKIVLQSIKDSWPPTWGDFNLRTLNNKYAKVTYAPTGRTYTDKNTGETKDSTTIKFLALYATEAECRTAYLTGNGTGAPATEQHSVGQAAAQAAGQVVSSVASAGGTTTTTTTAPSGGNGGGDAKARATAEQFLKVLVKQNGGDRDKVATAIAGMPLVSKFFTVDSPETMRLISDVVFEQMTA